MDKLALYIRCALRSVVRGGSRSVFSAFCVAAGVAGNDLFIDLSQTARSQSAALNDHQHHPLLPFGPHAAVHGLHRPLVVPQTAACHPPQPDRDPVSYGRRRGLPVSP